jgi:serine/threonine protein phosphatase PrpC
MFQSERGSRVPLKFTVVGKTDVGLVRSGNEDYMHLDEANGVFAVCDGMGGHQAGEVASMSAAETVHKVFNNFQSEIAEDPDLELDGDLPPKGDLLVKSIRLANRAVYNKAMSNAAQAGMGTTIVALALEDDVMSIAHVGDSRAYHIDDSGLVPLTRDHSWVAEMQDNQAFSEEEASSMIGKNVITRALGVRENVEVDYRTIKIKPGDKFFLCSDGLCGFADDEDMFQVVYKSRSEIRQIADNLVQMANDRGGADNVTVVVLEVLGTSESSREEVAVLTVPAETPEALIKEDEWLKKIDAYQLQKAPSKKKPDREGSGGSKLFILLIFIVFVVLAVFIIYSTGGD